MSTIALRLQTPLPETYTAALPADLEERIQEAKQSLGSNLVILGHHYQRDDVIQWADARGDSFKLARFAADHPTAKYIVFCGVHFMAESADILTGDNQHVMLPDLNAGCSMADMANEDQVLDAWDDLSAICGTEHIVPITYMNSSAALKAFVGEHGGAVCTSSNAEAILRWAFHTRKAEKVLFFPDQHLGRNTAVNLGFSTKDCVVWNPRAENGGLEEREIKEATFLLWRGHCSIHQRFRVAQIEEARQKNPDVHIIVHPECAHEVVCAADQAGSTEAIIKAIATAPAGTSWGVGTEIHLVHRLAQEHPDKQVFSLDPVSCPCSTMARIDPSHLAWTLEHLQAGQIVNEIRVDPDTTRWARTALERMLAIT